MTPGQGANLRGGHRTVKGRRGSLVSEANARSLDIHPYTVNEEQEMKDLISLGVDGMFTNFPDLLAGLTIPDTGGPPPALNRRLRGVRDLLLPCDLRLASLTKAHLEELVDLVRSLRRSTPDVILRPGTSIPLSKYKNLAAPRGGIPSGT